MKALLLICTYFLCFSLAFAQKIKVDDDIVTVDKVPYIKLDVKKKLMTGMKDVAILSLKDVPLVNYNFNTADSPLGLVSSYDWHSYAFLTLKDTIFLEGSNSLISKKDIIKFLLENELIKGDTVDTEAFKKVKAANAKNWREHFDKVVQEEKEMTKNASVMTERDTKAPIFLDERKGRIIQANIEIGTYAYKRIGWTEHLLIYNKAGSPVVRYSREASGTATSATMLALRDKKSETVGGFAGKTLVQNEVVRAAIAWAIKNRYL